MAANLEALRAAQENDCIIGPPRSPAGQRQPSRLEIDEFILDTDVANLFLLALLDMQSDENEQDPWSWFGISSIHGLPAGPWQGITEQTVIQSGQVNPVKDYWQRTADNPKGPYSIGPNPKDPENGYCAHASVLFPMWHRVYVSQMEQAIYLKMESIARQYKQGAIRTKYLEAVTRFRLPYWDPLIARQLYEDRQPVQWQVGFSKILMSREVRVRKPQSPTFLSTVRNPLYSYHFATVEEKSGSITKRVPKYKLDDQPPFKFTTMLSDPPYERLKTEGTNIVRGPNEETARAPRLDGRSDHSYLQEKWNPNGDGYRGPMESLCTNTRTMFELNNPSWEGFSTRASKKEAGMLYINPNIDASTRNRRLVSIEGYHDNIHNQVGMGVWSGHMVRLKWSSFDPIFWLHHCNVDRLIAMWQQLHWNCWTPWEMHSSEGTEAFPSEMKQNHLTPLVPFLKSRSPQTVFWTSEDVRDWRVLGYDYQDIPSGTSLDDASLRPLRERISYLYGWSLDKNTATMRGNHGVSNNLAECLPPVVFIDGGTRVPDFGDVDFSPHPAVRAAAPRTRSRGSGNPGRTGGSNIHLMTTSLEVSTTSMPQAVLMTRESPARHWDILVRCEKFSLNGSFSLFFFVGDIPDDATTWGSAENCIGQAAVLANEDDAPCARCREQRKSGLLITETVSITSALLSYTNGLTLGNTKLMSLAASDVVPFLRDDLKWVVLDKYVKRREPAEIAQLKVLVADTEYTAGANMSEFGSFGKVSDWVEITDGKIGGMSTGDVF